MHTLSEWLTLTHLQSHGRGHHQHSEQRHASHPAQVHVLQDEETRPAQLLHGVGRVPHVVHSFHFELLEETAAHVAQLVEAELAVVAAHPAVSCPLAQEERPQYTTLPEPASLHSMGRESQKTVADKINKLGLFKVIHVNFTGSSGYVKSLLEECAKLAE